MRPYRRLLNISYKDDHATNEEVRRKIQAAIGEYDEFLTLVTKRKLRWFWPCLKVFWFSKDNPTGHSERKKIKETDRRRGGETISKSGQEWTLPAQLRQLKTSQNGKGLLRMNLWCPDDLPRLWDRIEENNLILGTVVPYNVRVL